MNKTTITGNWRFVVYVLFATLFLLINYSTQRTDFIQLISLYCCAFGLYVIIYKYWNTDVLINEGKWLGIAIRFSILFSMPNLTDDFYRFIWDGHLSINHINPYAYTPDMVKAQNYLGADNMVLNDSLYQSQDHILPSTLLSVNSCFQYQRIYPEGTCCSIKSF